MHSRLILAAFAMACSANAALFTFLPQKLGSADSAKLPKDALPGTASLAVPDCAVIQDATKTLDIQATAECVLLVSVHAHQLVLGFAEHLHRGLSLLLALTPRSCQLAGP